MKIVTGVDLIEISRVEDVIARHGLRFLQRVYTPKEVYEAGEHSGSLAVRFAAKEAVAKALGTGIGPIGWKEIEILRDETHQPKLHLCGAANQLARDLNLTKWSISLSHTQSHAIAMVVAWGEDEK